MQNADFVIIGSGSAGSAIAYRLSEDGKHSVIVIEAGGSDFGPFIQMPAALAWPMSMTRYNWGYHSEPEPNLNNRRITAPRGKVLGGSSSINAMVYTRGHPDDYAEWGEAASGWGWDAVLSAYRAIEANGLKPVIDKVFAFAEAQAAYRHLKSQKHFGKIVISHA